MAGNLLSELAKRVPKNQEKQFKVFMALNVEYKKRVSKYPEKLPKIDWEYYRTNVRSEAIKLVKEFEIKYEEMNKVFDERSKLDTTKYYEEVEKQRVEVQAEIEQYKAESNERIKAYEAEIKRICNMKPYSEMTVEEFIELRPELAEFIPRGGRPLFWPHTPEEQLPSVMSQILQADGGAKGGGGSGGGGLQAKPGQLKPKALSQPMTGEKVASIPQLEDPIKMQHKPEPADICKTLKPRKANAEKSTGEAETTPKMKSALSRRYKLHEYFGKPQSRRGW